MLVRSGTIAMLMATLVAVGCDDSTEAPDGGTAAKCRGTGETYTYVLSDVGLPDENADGTRWGVNVDGIVSTDGESADDKAGCYKPDVTSPPPDNETGVDNALVPLLELAGPSVDLAGETEGAIRNGQMLILVKVSDVDDLSNDDCVAIEVLMGAKATQSCTTIGEACGETGYGWTCNDTAAEGDSPLLICTPSFTGDTMNPNQKFDIDSNSYLENEEFSTPRISGFAALVAGRVKTDPVSLPLELPVRGECLKLGMNDAQIRFDITADGISKGVLGGALIISELVESLGPVLPAGFTPESIAPVLANVADIDATPVEESDTRVTCSSLSIGLTIAGTPAVIGNTVTGEQSCAE